MLLGLYLAELGLDAAAVGTVVGAGLAGLALGTAWVAWRGEPVGRRGTLMVATLLAGAGLAGLAAPMPLPMLAAIACVGMVNGMGRDRGPAQTLEQSMLADAVPDAARTAVFARYSLVQDLSGAVGSLAAAGPKMLQAAWTMAPVTAYQWTFIGAGLLTLLPLAMYARLPAGEAHGAPGLRSSGPPSPETRRRVARLTALFGLDSLGGGFLAGSIISYWFFRRFGIAGDVLGPVFFAARGLNALSYLAAERMARRIGLVRTMVFTHLPSSVFLIALPFVPSAAWAITLFLAREALVQMDVPTRQSYVAAVVAPGERTFALGVTGIARNVGWAVGPPVAGLTMSAFGIGAPLVAGALLKIIYDLALFASFRAVRPPEETA